MDATINAEQLDLDLFPSVQGGSGGAAMNYSVAIDAKNVTARSTGADRLGALTLAVRNDEFGLQIERFDLRGGDNARMTGSGKFGTAGGRLETQIDAGNIAPFLIAAQRLFPALALEPVIQRAQTLNPAALAITVQQASASENIAATIAGTVGSTRVDANIGGPARRLPNDKWDAAIERGTLKISTPDFSHFLQTAWRKHRGPAAERSQNSRPQSTSTRAMHLLQAMICASGQTGYLTVILAA